MFAIPGHNETLMNTISSQSLLFFFNHRALCQGVPVSHDLVPIGSVRTVKHMDSTSHNPNFIPLRHTFSRAVIKLSFAGIESFWATRQI